MEKVSLSPEKLGDIIKVVLPKLKNPEDIKEVIDLALCTEEDFSTLGINEKSLTLDEEEDFRSPFTKEEIKFLAKIKLQTELRDVDDLFYNNICLDPRMDRALARQAISLCNSKEDILSVYEGIMAGVFVNKDKSIENLLIIKKMIQLF